jgi:CDP-paratose 2-epimerase
VDAYLSALKKADAVLHLAGQTAVTTSIKDPVLDFESNIVGSFKILEALRNHAPTTPLLFSSTNKVYGDLSHHHMNKNEETKRYENTTTPNGVDETEPVNFISPYGCSNGAVDFYVQDYARSFGMKTVVFRQSCIYGPMQIGVEDQGWVAHFSKQFLTNKPVNIFGDGYQVRDLLYVDDLVNAYTLALENIDVVSGETFNIGGGVNNSYSLHQVLDILENEIGTRPAISFSDERLGDQKYFVSANTKLDELLVWKPRMDFQKGVKEMIAWQKEYVK